MTPLPDGLLAAVIESPDDDGLRLIAADWWEEHGEVERAEFVRVQVELAKPLAKCEKPAFTGKGILACAEWNGRHPDRNNWCGPCDDRSKLRRREQELLSSDTWHMWSEWVPNVVWTATDYGRNGADFSQTFRRGFVESIRCTWESWLAHCNELRLSTPLRSVELTTLPVDRVSDAEGTHRILNCTWPGITFTLPRSTTLSLGELGRQMAEQKERCFLDAVLRGWDSSIDRDASFAAAVEADRNSGR